MITIEQVEPDMTVKADGRIQFLVWHLCRDKLPAMLPEDISDSEWFRYFREHQYICLTSSGFIQEIHWFNGWNCSPGSRVHEIHDVIAWAEIENPFPEEVRLDDSI